MKSHGFQQPSPKRALSCPDKYFGSAKTFAAGAKHKTWFCSARPPMQSVMAAHQWLSSGGGKSEQGGGRGADRGRRLRQRIEQLYGMKAAVSVFYSQPQSAFLDPPAKLLMQVLVVLCKWQSLPPSNGTKVPLPGGDLEISRIDLQCVLWWYSCVFRGCVIGLSRDYFIFLGFLLPSPKHV